jgi:hypothetical protein
MSDILSKEKVTWPERVRGHADLLKLSKWWEDNGAGCGDFYSITIPSNCEVSIQGPSVPLLAQTLISMIKHLHKYAEVDDYDRPKFQADVEGVRCNSIPSFKSFMAPIRTYSM